MEQNCYAKKMQCKAQQENTCLILINMTHLQNATSTQLTQTDVLYWHVKVEQQRLSTIYTTQPHQKFCIYTVK